MSTMFHFRIGRSNMFDNMDLEILNFGKSFRAYRTFKSENNDQGITKKLRKFEFKRNIARR